MESVVGRDLAGVRVYTSPLAEALGARALTSGQRIVFAPGRMEFQSASGLTLLGHELAHLGTSLAFKRLPGGPPGGEAEEGAAEEQEAVIQRLVENGWPAGPEMAVRRGNGPLQATSARASVASEQVVTAYAELAVSRAASAPVRRVGVGSASVDEEEEAIPEARFSVPQAEEPRAGSSQPDVDALARRVYDILRQRLRTESDRHDMYARVGFS
jgi:hypothetical protein